MLTSQVDFNYWCDMQVVHDDPKSIRYKLFYCTFDQETRTDTLCKAVLHLNYFDPKLARRSEVRFMDNW